MLHPPSSAGERVGRSREKGLLGLDMSVVFKNRIPILVITLHLPVLPQHKGQAASPEFKVCDVVGNDSW